ncbi:MULTISPECIES: SDR family oxidoreductase [unclassified Pseudomonas]|uniref:SDR family oxidoreductase n=1 Tax=unclassified Pseudomonas TaxID=196821 RepID=UPI0018E7CA92|nr:MULTISPECIES: SDR family oxidoreductase [unclassified Pseudomonas]MBJ2303698.1 SDR family oxidoreductase [Pseudomonas sp. MF2846]MBK3490309.1 SDR family oxidoreductase [Pseudomonas sp. MF2857]
MNFGLEGKVAFVSGGSKGIGRACCELLAVEGCKVIVVARNNDAIEQTVAALRDAGGIASGVIADLTRPGDVQRAVGVARQTFGSPDIVITNVHGGEPSDFLDGDTDAFLTAFQNLVMSVVHLAQATIPHMREQRWGRLLTIGTAAAKEPAPGLNLMAATTARAAVVTLNKSLADEFACDGITVNTLATGWIATTTMLDEVGRMARERGMPADALLQRLTKSIPVGRAGHPQEIASLAVYLCSAKAGYMNGCLIPVDGGSHRSAW